MNKVYCELYSRARENNKSVDNDFLLIKSITNKGCYTIKYDDKKKQDYIDNAKTEDILIRKSDIDKIVADFPVRIYMKNDMSYECLQSFSMIYNQLYRDCSMSPYTPYGEYNKIKETKSENKVDEDFL